ncbi:MAG: DNA polymerase I [Peptococcaceae bacterium]|nr:DNA polymerase I [Peptococcaceae bacterium]
MPRMIILDGNSLINRAFYALPPFTSAQGQATNAVHGFLSMLFKLYMERKPEYWLVAFDKTKALVRIEQYPLYKAQRKETPELLRPQFGYVKEILRELGIPMLEVEGYEADDIIATVAVRAAQDSGSLDVEIYTGDKDAFQLISPQITVCMTRKGISEIEEFNEAHLYEVYQLLPGQIPDLKGLMGDSSDNIPGVPGVGEKTALKLLWQYGSLENVLDHAAEVSGKKLPVTLQEHADMARLSKKLATVLYDTPLEYALENYAFCPPDGAKASVILGKFSLNMVKKLFSKAFGLESAKSAEGTGSVEMPVEVATEEFDVFGSEREFEDPVPDSASMPLDQASGLPLCPGPKTWKKLSADEGWRLLAAWPQDKPLALAYRFLGESPHKGVWSHLGFSDSEQHVSIDRTQCSTDNLETLRRVLQDGKTPKIVADSKSLEYVLGNEGWTLHGLDMDMSLAAYLINSNLGNYKPADILPHNAPFSASKAGELFQGVLFEAESGAGAGVGAGAGSGGESGGESEPNPDLGPDLGQEAALFSAVWPGFRTRLTELGLMPLLNTLEQPLAPVLNEMERYGIAVDSSHLEEMGSQVVQQLTDLEKEIYSLATVEFNINSTQQLGKILFETLGLPPVKKTKTGYSTDADSLAELCPLHPIVDKILLYRHLGKLNSTYIKGLNSQIVEGRIHTTFQQMATATGRLSSVEPNLQNIPIRLDMGRRLRRAFTPSRPGWKLFSADYSQIELRILAHYSEDKLLCEAFHKEEDVHTRTASEIFGIPLAEVTSQRRRQAKAVNFGLIYGLTDFGLARDLGIPRSEAKVYTAQYFKRYLGVKRYLEESVMAAKETGEVRTLLNRLRRIPELKHPSRNVRQFGERIAKNTPIQGTAADIMKLAMLRVAKQITSLKLEAVMLLQVHDELLFEVAPDALPALAGHVKEIMENIYRLSVPLVVDCSVGDNWYDMEEYNA